MKRRNDYLTQEMPGLISKIIEKSASPPKARTPIEMMVDKACGFDSTAPLAPRGPIMWCPDCEKQLVTQLHPSDPSGTVVISFPCLECIDQTKPFPAPQYYDSTGKELKPSWKQ